MTYAEAIKLVRSEFETVRDSGHSEIIRTGLTYDGCNGFTVAVYDKGDKAILCDFGETKEFFDEVPDEEWVRLCEENGCAFHHWRIERDLNSIDDVYEYIRFIDMISDKYCGL